MDKKTMMSEYLQNQFVRIEDERVDNKNEISRMKRDNDNQLGGINEMEYRSGLIKTLNRRNKLIQHEMDMIIELGELVDGGSK